MRGAKLRIWLLVFHAIMIEAKALKYPAQFFCVDDVQGVAHVNIQNCVPLQLHTVDAQNDAVGNCYAIHRMPVPAIEDKKTAMR
jgi:hypothetical protein